MYGQIHPYNVQRTVLHWLSDQQAALAPVCILPCEVKALVTFLKTLWHVLSLAYDSSMHGYRIMNTYCVSAADAYAPCIYAPHVPSKHWQERSFQVQILYSAGAGLITQDR